MKRSKAKAVGEKNPPGEKQLDITTADVPPTPGDAYAYVANNNFIKASILRNTTNNTNSISWHPH